MAPAEPAAGREEIVVRAVFPASPPPLTKTWSASGIMDGRCAVTP